MKIIGIDPDLKTNGVSILENNNIELLTLNFFKLQEFLFENKSEIKLVVIEKGEINKVIFNAKGKSANVGLRIAQNVGQNFAITTLIAEYCENLKIKFEFFVPNKHTPKFNHQFLKSVGIKKNKSNQEERL
jgi:hypothetical protein